jgi:hypothetical protein
MNRDIRADVNLQLSYAFKSSTTRHEPIGGSQDAAFTFAVAADQDALAERLLNCATAHYALAHRALTDAGKLREAARGLELVIYASEARIRANNLLEDAVVFERAADRAYDDVVIMSKARNVWTRLMRDGTLSEELYEYGMDDLPIRNTEALLEMYMDGRDGSIEQTEEDKKFTEGTDWENA